MQEDCNIESVEPARSWLLLTGKIAILKGTECGRGASGGKRLKGVDNQNTQSFQRGKSERQGHNTKKREDPRGNQKKESQTPSEKGLPFSENRSRREYPATRMPTKDNKEFRQEEATPSLRKGKRGARGGLPIKAVE